jgi:hypothetical protein
VVRREQIRRGGWSGFKDLGGSFTLPPVPLYDPITGALEVYALGTGGTLEEDYWAGTWSGLRSLGGSLGNP